MQRVFLIKKVVNANNFVKLIYEEQDLSVFELHKVSFDIFDILTYFNNNIIKIIL